MNTYEKMGDLISLCQDLVQINSENPPGNENDLIRYCEELLFNLNAEVEVVKHSKTRSSLIARWNGWEKEKKKKKEILFVCHADTVPAGNLKNWDGGPFSADMIDGKIYGRGASDMKSGIAAVISALKLLKDTQPKNTITFLLTADEECYGMGVEIFTKPSYKLDPDIIFIPEPTENHIAIAEKGTLWLELTTKGKSGHASKPEQGKNAVLLMTTLLEQLDFSHFLQEEHDLLGRFSACVTTIRGGNKINVIPDSCSATIDIRFLPGQKVEQIITFISSQANKTTKDKKFDKIEIKSLLQREAIENAPLDLKIENAIKTVKKIKEDAIVSGVSYFTDAAVLVSHFRAPFFICGPGKVETMHTNNEYVSVNKLIESFEIYQALIKSLMDK